MGRKAIDLTGEQFERLLVIERVENKNSHTMWKCKCKCGNEIIANGTDLKRGKYKSCGCLRLEKVTKHSLSNTNLYYVWCCIKKRCCNINYKQYINYGGRGVTVCNEWLNDFTAFYNWAMSNGYKEGLSIDRIDVNGNYEPSNCRWVDMKTQQNNRRNNHLVSVNGVTHTIAEWAMITGLKYDTIKSRLKRGWTEYDAIFK